MTQNPTHEWMHDMPHEQMRKMSARLFFMDNSKNSMTKEKLYIVDVQAEIGHSGNINVFSDVEKPRGFNPDRRQ